MHGVVVSVKISGETASDLLQSTVVPRVKAQPGFVSATWLQSDDGATGVSLALFETKEQAEEAAKNVQPPPGAPVTITKVEVGEVVAQA
jgi:hypothetical protein